MKTQWKTTIGHHCWLREKEKGKKKGDSKSVVAPVGKCRRRDMDENPQVTEASKRREETEKRKIRGRKGRGA